MDVAELFPHAKVVLSSDRLTLGIDRLDDDHVAINEGHNTYKIRFAIVEVACEAYTLVAIPLSGLERATLQPPAWVVLNFWDQELVGSVREDPTRTGNTFTLKKFGIRTRYVFCFEEGIEFARCMELFFITRRLVLRRNLEIQSRDYEIERLQGEILADMAESI